MPASRSSGPSPSGGHDRRPDEVRGRVRAAAGRARSRCWCSGGRPAAGAPARGRRSTVTSRRGSLPVDAARARAGRGNGTGPGAAVQPEPGRDLLPAPAGRGRSGARVRRVRGRRRRRPPGTGARPPRMAEPRETRGCALRGRASGVPWTTSSRCSARATRDRWTTCFACASAPHHPLPRRGRRPGREGRALRGAARCGRSRCASGPVRCRGGRRAGLSRHFRDPRRPAHHARHGEPRRRLRVHPFHRGRGHPLRGRRRAGAPCRRRQGGGQHRGRPRSDAGRAPGEHLRLTVRGRRGRREAGRRPRHGHGDRGSRADVVGGGRLDPAGRRRSARGKSC